MLRRLLSIIGPLLLSGVCAQALPPPMYSAKEIRGTVAEAAGSGALEGVIVLAEWLLEPLSGTKPRLHIAEVVTDTSGRFHIPSWGPKPRAPLTELRDRSPELIVFKPGYAPVVLFNPPKEDFPAWRAHGHLPTRRLNNSLSDYRGNPDDALQDSVWNGMTIRLEVFTGSPTDWFNTLDFISSEIDQTDAKLTRRLNAALRAELSQFKEAPPGVAPAIFASLFLRLDTRLSDQEGAR